LSGALTFARMTGNRRPADRLADLREQLPEK
jgi:hypothetical protein